MSRKAINRWAVVNHIDPSSSLLSLLYSASSSIFVMASLSDDPIAGEYVLSRSQVAEIGQRLKEALQKEYSTGHDSTD
jgi:hypothetical protein